MTHDAAVSDARTMDVVTPADDGSDDDASDRDAASPGTPPTYAPTFSAVFNEVFEQRFCTSVFCHGIGGATLNFSSIGAAYQSLVNHEATGAMCRDRGLSLVVPGQPDASLLFAKIAQMTPPCGARMPNIPGVVLNASEIDQVREWIVRGALND